MPFVSIILLLVAVLVIVAIFRAVRIVKQSTAIIVERLGRFQAAYGAGMHFLVPFIDRVRNIMDLREQVVSFPPQPVITSDNLVVSIDSVVYYQITDPMRATYEISNYLQAIEQLTVTTLRNQPRPDQRPAARRPGPGHRPLGNPRQQRGAEVHRPARLHPGLHGAADARRA